MSDVQRGILKPKELGNVIDGVMKENVILSADARNVMARLYERFRHVIVSAITHDDQGPAFTMMVADIMVFLNTFRLDGLEKKQILLEVIRIVIRFEIPAEKADSLLQLLDKVISQAIDLAVYFQKQNSGPKNRRVCLCM